MNQMGQEIYDLANRIFPICRSLTGDGVRETIDILQDYIRSDGIHFDIHEVPTGTQVFDWTIPKEWSIASAYIEDRQGNKIIDLKDHNLHVMGYSAPVDKWVTLDELKSILYTQPDQPDAIPYVTSYYKERYGFCMTQRQLDSLEEGEYHIYIDSKLFDGSLTYAELVLPGDSEQEILFSSYICHPSMANNECSGAVMLTALTRYIKRLEHHKYTYRFVLNPETIGSITFLSRNLDHLKKNLAAGFVLSCVGDDRDYSIIHSRYADTLADRALTSILETRPRYSEYSYLMRGSDERQYNAPGIELPVVGFCRTKYGMYPEYHTSLDNMGLVSPTGFQGTWEVLTQLIQCLEANARYKMTVLGEPQLGKRGLYPTVSQKGSYGDIKPMMDFIAYADGRNDLFGIADRIQVSPYELLSIIDKLEKNGLIKKVEMNNE